MRTNILGSVSEGVLAGRTYDAYRWLVVEDDGTPVGAALRTSPYPMALSPMTAAAAAALGLYAGQVEPMLPAAMGPREAVEAFAASGGWPAARLVMEEYLRVLGTLVSPSVRAAGRARPAGPQDLDLLVDWYEQFVIDARLTIPVAPERVREVVADGVLWLWEDDGRPVAMGGHAPLVTTPGGTVARIGPVFTPQSLRGRGYGSAITGTLAAMLLDRADTVMLFADAANPESNSVYERLGFAVAAELIEVEFGAPAWRPSSA